MLFSEPALKNEKWGMKIESVEDVERKIIWNLEAVKSSQSSIVTAPVGRQRALESFVSPITVNFS